MVARTSAWPKSSCTVRILRVPCSQCRHGNRAARTDHNSPKRESGSLGRGRLRRRAARHGHVFLHERERGFEIGAVGHRRQHRPDDQKNSLLDQSTPRVQERFSRLDEENLLIEHEIVRDGTTNAPVDLAIFIDDRRLRLQEKGP